LAVALYGLQQPKRRRHEIDDLRGGRRSRICCDALPERDEQGVDELQLPMRLLGVITSDIVEDGSQLPGQCICQDFSSAALQCKHVRSVEIQSRSQTLSDQQIVEAVRERHRVSSDQNVTRYAGDRCDRCANSSGADRYRSRRAFQRQSLVASNTISISATTAKPSSSLPTLRAIGSKPG